VTDDIIARLNEVWECATYPWQRNAINDAKAEIERLRTALEVAANHMSMTGAPQTTIDAIRNAVRGG